MVQSSPAIRAQHLATTTSRRKGFRCFLTVRLSLSAGFCLCGQISVQTVLMCRLCVPGRVTNIPVGMVTDQFGMIGLLTFIRAAETDPGMVHLALGSDLTTLGLNLNSPEYDEHTHTNMYTHTYIYSLESCGGDGANTDLGSAHHQYL